MNCKICNYNSENNIQFMIHCDTLLHKEKILLFLYKNQSNPNCNEVQNILKNIEYIASIMGETYDKYILNIRKEMHDNIENNETNKSRLYLSLLNEMEIIERHKLEEKKMNIFIKGVRENYDNNENNNKSQYNDGIIEVPKIINNLSSSNYFECLKCKKKYKFKKSLEKHIINKH